MLYSTQWLRNDLKNKNKLWTSSIEKKKKRSMFQKVFEFLVWMCQPILKEMCKSWSKLLVIHEVGTQPLSVDPHSCLHRVMIFHLNSTKDRWSSCNEFRSMWWIQLRSLRSKLRQSIKVEKNERRIEISLILIVRVDNQWFQQITSAWLNEMTLDPEIEDLILYQSRLSLSISVSKLLLKLHRLKSCLKQ